MRALHVLLAWVLSACAQPAPSEGPVGAAACATCHPTEATQFATSRHQQSNASRLFQALRARATVNTQGFCDGCHARHDDVGDPMAGVTCITCHTATGNEGVQNGALLIDPNGPMSGALSDPVPTTAHASRASGFVASADLCGTCHEVHGPGAFVETPYAEWSQSTAAGVVTCAQCHMSAVPGDGTATPTQGPAAVIDGGTFPVRSLADHRFVGPDDDAGGAALLAQALSITLARDAAGALAVSVQNRNAGHAFPSGARFAREAWIEVAFATTADGPWTIASGGIDPSGAPRVEAMPRTDFSDRVTHAGMPVLPMDADPPEVRAIPAGGVFQRTYDVPTSTAEGAPPRVARVRVRYRTIAYALRMELGLTDPPDAILDLAAVTLTW